MKAPHITRLIGITLIGLPCHIVQGQVNNNTITIGNVTIDTNMEMCNFTRFYAVVEDVKLNLNLYEVLGVEEEDGGGSRDRALSTDSEDGGEGDGGLVSTVDTTVSGVHPQQAEIEAFITLMESTCMETYNTYCERLAGVEMRSNAADDAYELVQSNLEAKFKTETEALIANCESRKENALALKTGGTTSLSIYSTEAKEGASTLEEKSSTPIENVFDPSTFDVTSSIQEQCDQELLAAFDQQETEVFNAQAFYEKQTQGFLEEANALTAEFVTEVGVMEDNLYEALAPGAFHLQVKLEAEIRILEQKLREIREMFSGGICCDFHQSTGEMLMGNEVTQYQNGIKHCYNVAMRKHGFADMIKEVTLVEHGSTCNDTDSTAATAATAAPGGLRGRRKLWGYSCGACFSGNCGFGCGSNTYSSSNSGWRRDLLKESADEEWMRNLSDDEEYSGVDLSTAEDVRTDIESCMLDWVNRKIPRVFPYGVTEQCRCESCDLNACVETSVAADDLGLNGF